MGRLLYFDCFSGASGDMIVGALIDAGLPLEEVRRALRSLDLSDCKVDAERVDRAGVSATKLRVHTPETVPPGAPSPPSPRRGDELHSHPPAGRHEIHAHHGDPHHHHQGHEHPHRSLAEISRLVDCSALTPRGKAKAQALFRRLAEVEAAIHQLPIDRIHLHEVGALDSIVDIVGAVHGLEWFGADQILASPLNVGGGTVHCAHGLFPVPAPATAHLLREVPIYSSGTDGELVTPTGALLLTGYATSFGPLPPMTVERIGYGAGDRNPPHRPNVLRLFVGRSSEGFNDEQVVVMECEIDDMNPQIFGALMERLHEAGALDVFYVPVQMKKNRPGTLLTVVVPPDRREALSAMIFRETTTLGLRYHELRRERLAREVISVETPAGVVRVKVARRGGSVVNVAPEFDDCARLAAARGVPIKDVQALAMKAYLESQQRSDGS